MAQVIAVSTLVLTKVAIQYRIGFTNSPLSYSMLYYDIFNICSKSNTIYQIIRVSKLVNYVHNPNCIKPNKPSGKSLSHKARALANTVSSACIKLVKLNLAQTKHC